MAAISRLASVDAAKKRVQPIPPNALLEISKFARRMPPAIKVTEPDLLAYLDAGKAHQGAGVVTLICMLAVETSGDYAPIDRKVVKGLLDQGKITNAQRTDLLSSDISAFTRCYIASVIPAWHESRVNRLPVAADNYWGSGGKE